MHMYTQHFRLNKLPFENVPDPQFFYNQGDHARIRQQISGSLESGRGLIVVTGPIGSGKTTLSQMIKADFPESIKLIWMAEPPANSNDLYLFLAQELELNPSSSEKTFVMRDIRNALLKTENEGKKCLVIIDESHLMSDDVLNGIRLLNNLEEGSKKLIQLLLLGQEELMEKINRPAMEPFKQRIAALETLGKMNVDVVGKYIDHRIKVAGGSTELISDTGWEALSIAFHAGGTPRTINSLCDRSFNIAYERNKSVVDAHDVYEATQRLGLRTDVFHYIISLKSKERDKQEELSATQGMAVQQQSPLSGTVQQHQTILKESAPPFLTPTNKRAYLTEDRAPELALSADSFGIKTKPALSYEDLAENIKEKYAQKNLKGPVILLVSSVSLFIVSFLFYCHTSDYKGYVDCFFSLFAF
ncbi:general secretion pathway protein A [Nitrosomonas sp. PY1]|uniref:ExeA family protein n=1 Tax=Nitrosomonas sp. PY1 TaxID=1803906 RepID=UPI001FC830DE|nr:AAA family ATPase [Nitrosomonas sp. PY1]GKS69162.1 general secretion pathway protein A [Nitrosomonas sp. PY1]